MCTSAVLESFNAPSDIREVLHSFLSVYALRQVIDFSFAQVIYFVDTK